MSNFDSSDILMTKNFRKWLSRRGIDVARIHETHLDEQIESLWYSYEDDSLSED